MANVSFSGFAVDMFGPAYGSELFEAVLEKFTAGQWDLASVSTSSIQLFTTGPAPNGSWTLSGAFSAASEAALLNSRIFSVSIAATAGGAFTDLVTLSSLNLTLGSFLTIDLTQGVFGGNDVISD